MADANRLFFGIDRSATVPIIAAPADFPQPTAEEFLERLREHDRECATPAKFFISRADWDALRRYGC